MSAPAPSRSARLRQDLGALTILQRRDAIDRRPQRFTTLSVSARQAPAAQALEHHLLAGAVHLAAHARTVGVDGDIGRRPRLRRRAWTAPITSSSVVDLAPAHLVQAVGRHAAISPTLRASSAISRAGRRLRDRHRSRASSARKASAIGKRP